MIEYDCGECGRYMVDVLLDAPPARCMTCTHLPNWHDDPIMRALFGLPRKAEMREMTDEEKAVAYAGEKYHCCFCSRELTEGPRGGASINMLCECGAVLNMIAPEYRERYGDDVAVFGQVVELPKRWRRPDS